MSGDCFIVSSAFPTIFNVMLVKYHKMYLVVTCQLMGEGMVYTITPSCCNSSLPFQESPDIFKQHPPRPLPRRRCVIKCRVKYLQGKASVIYSAFASRRKMSPLQSIPCLASGGKTQGGSGAARPAGKHGIRDSQRLQKPSLVSSFASVARAITRHPSCKGGQDLNFFLI